MAEERRLAICIKGGVSLGAYEAGVLAKTLELIANNNSLPNAIPWYIDAFSGASAGSMTAVATLCTLLNSKNDYLFDMWVSGASLSALAPDSTAGVDDGFRNHDNLLAASALDQLAHGFDTLPTAVANRHGALRPGGGAVRMIFTLSNINGVVQPIDTLNPTPLAFREYADSARCDVTVDQNGNLSVSSPDTRAITSNHGNNDSSTAWDAAVQSAIASGSFPLAFAPRGLWRWHPERKAYSAEFYSDGGLFDNDPVGKLINLAHEIDWAPENAAYQDRQRRYLIVHTAPADAADTSIQRPASWLDLNPIALAGKIVPAFMDESMESGLRGITAVNQRFQQRLEVLNRFAKVAAASPGSTGPLQTAISALAALRGFDDHQLQTLRNFLIPDLKDADAALHDYVVRLPSPAQT
ncbi:MAG TPA: patatin-like phospholipase family protein, partial [Candidatus Binataceae bacterium]|nr:patatin-like phospholipase family protein [Candidatus Binataceae bacterium]